MIEVADRVYRLGSAFHNYYVVVDGGKATVVDTGASKELRHLEAGLGSLGMTLADVEMAVLSHAHGDHIGFAKEIHDRGTDVRTHVDEAPYARGDVTGHSATIRDLPIWKPKVISFVFALFKAGFLNVHRVPGVETFDDGEVLDVPGALRVVATPGHTVGHAAFLMEERRILFSGDALVTMDMFGGRAGPQLLPPAFHSDVDTAAASLDTLAGLDVELTLPGHGEPWRAPVSTVVDAARARLSGG